jgi:hypothetical protein
MNPQIFAEQFASVRVSSAPPSPVWSRHAVLGTLIAVAKINRLPVNAWPLEAGLERLAAEADERSQLMHALSGWGRSARAGRAKFAVRECIAALIESRLLRVEGQGAHAVLIPDVDWVAGHAAVLLSSPTADRKALRVAGQVVAEMATISSKTRTASTPARSGTRRSSIARLQVVTC